MTASRHRRYAVSAAAALSLGLCMAAASGTPAAATPTPSQRPISGADPLPAAGAPGACGSPAEFQGWEQEPTMAVDPSSSANLVVAWIQDYSDAIVTAHSGDGGRSWSISVPKTVACTGGAAEYGAGASAFDPSLSFGPAAPVTGARTVYLVSELSLPSPAGPLSYAVVVHHSTDGGRTWSDPATVAQSATPIYLDGTSIAADPNRPGRAYVAWRQGDPAFASRQQFVSRTEDGGATWTAGLPIVTDGFQLSGHLHVLADGTVLNVMSSIPVPRPGTARSDVTGPTTLLATRSADLGVTWSPPVTIAVADETHLTNLASAIGPNGKVYVAWQRSDGASSSILLVGSSTGGLSWSAPSVVSTEPGAPLLPLFASPELAVGSDGTVGIGFYDHRNASASAPGTSDYWFRTARNGTGAWREQHVAGPFDVNAAPLGFLGDYQGVVALDKGFGLAITIAGSGVQAPPTGIVWATAQG